MDIAKKIELKKIACDIRKAIVEQVFYAKSGHPGGSLSIADTLTYLYFVQMNVDPKNPKMENRDRLVLSKGHTAPGLYATLAMKGFFDKQELKKLRKAGAMLQGHPDMKGTPGVDMSTGSLGQGISAACGMALSSKISGKQNKVYAILGDGELQEGQVWEAAMFAAHNKLNNLIAVVDNNGLQIDGKITDICSPQPITDKFEAFGWNVLTADAHDFDDLERVFNLALKENEKPTVIVQKSYKGNGVSFMLDNAAWHGAAPNEEQYNIAMNELEQAYCEL